MADQHHELAHVFTEASQGVNDVRGGTPVISTHRIPFPAIPKQNGPKKLRHCVSRFASPTA